MILTYYNENYSVATEVNVPGFRIRVKNDTSINEKRSLEMIVIARLAIVAVKSENSLWQAEAICFAITFGLSFISSLIFND